MIGKSKKVLETENYVDEYILKHGYSPTYDNIAVHFGIAASVAYARCSKFREKMKGYAYEGTPRFVKIKLESWVPYEKLKAFTALFAQIDELLKDETEPVVTISDYIKGYRVQANFNPISEEAAKAKQEAIVKVIVDSAKKHERNF